MSKPSLFLNLLLFLPSGRVHCHVRCVSTQRHIPFYSAPLVKGSSDHRCSKLILSRNKGKKSSKHKKGTEIVLAQDAQDTPENNV